MHYVYVIQNAAAFDEFYLGFSSDLRQRLGQHNAGQNTSTRGRNWRLVYYEAYLHRSAAAKRERILKYDGRVRRFLMDRIKDSLVERDDSSDET
jgi:putative endonuclease